MRTIWLLPLLAVAFACGGGATSNSSSPVQLTQVVTGLNAPVFLTAPPGDPSRLFVVEKFGAIRIIKNGILLLTPFLDLGTKVTTLDEEGLLGMAFHPSFATNGRFFVQYSDLNGNNQVSEFQVSANPDVADPNELPVLGVTMPAATTTHRGGMLAFGPDGYLYVAVGNGGEFTGTSQELNNLLGKILRIDVNGASPYGIPPDNPFVLLAGTSPEIWSYGLRNPWRFSFDRQTGDLYIGDVGESQREEIDVAPAATGGGAGANFGWDIMEGTTCYAASVCSSAGLVPPTAEYGRGMGCAVIGGYVYRGGAIPALRGHYFFGDYCFGWVRSFRYANGGVTQRSNWRALDRNLSLAGFGEDASGELYVVGLGGEVFRIDPAQ